MTTRRLAPAEIAAALGQASLFAGLDREVLGSLAAVATVRQVPPRTVLFEKGRPGDALYVVLSGELKATVLSPEGKEVIFSIMGTGEVIGEIALLDGGERSATVSAVRESSVVVLQRRDFVSLLRRDPKLSEAVLVRMARRVRDLSELLEDALLLSVQARLAKKLLVIAEAHGSDTPEGRRVDLPLSQGDLANLVGTIRESVNRQIRAWQREGVISVRDGRIVIRRRGPLERLASATWDG